MLVFSLDRSMQSNSWLPPDGPGPRRLRPRLGRRVAVPLAVGVLGLATLAGSTASAGATPLPVTVKLVGKASALSSPMAAAKKGPACPSLRRSDLARLFKSASAPPMTKDLVRACTASAPTPS